MAKVCDVTGITPQAGNNVSHAKNRTRRRFVPNLHKKRFWVPSLGQYVTLRVSARGQRTIDKKGIEVVLKEIKARANKS